MCNVCVCSTMCAQICVHGSEKSTSTVFVYCFPHYCFFAKVSHWSWNSLIGWINVHLFWPLQVLGVQVCATTPRFLQKCWRSAITSSGLSGKHFADWFFPLSHCHHFFTLPFLDRFGTSQPVNIFLLKWVPTECSSPISFYIREKENNGKRYSLGKNSKWTRQLDM